MKKIDTQNATDDATVDANKHTHLFQDDNSAYDSFVSIGELGKNKILDIWTNGFDGLHARVINKVTGEKIGNIIDIDEHSGLVPDIASVTRLTAGKDLITWTDGQGVYGRIYDDKTGFDFSPKFQIAQGLQTHNPDAITLENGNVVVDYLSDSKNNATLIDIHTMKMTSFQLFKDGFLASAGQHTLHSLADGGFVALGIYGAGNNEIQAFDAQGIAKGTALHFSADSLDVLSNGEIVTAAPGIGNEFIVNILDNNASHILNTVHEHIPVFAYQSQIRALADGTFMVAWEGDNEKVLYAEHFAADGDSLSPVTRLMNGGDKFTVEALSNGGFTAEVSHSGSGGGVQGAVFDPHFWG